MEGFQIKPVAVANETHIYMAEDGTRSTMPLVAQGGNRYQMLTLPEEQHGMQVTVSQALTDGVPFDPGELKGQ